ncbi:MAG TPA: GNAT family N-acetyltransferase [Flexivirga sp.]|uniref:GNAT family N-acetyltransferase n=1 Tax=Flexivirga sp. TaxID=1962927 RepID=UPI002BC3614D|nr:GNAT family N-acetyltransferase [Flexivirga sp.]HWC21248.1 GNAT family N-acetyltransferase [Flexivirga sp.]
MVTQVNASGLEALELSTRLLQRSRSADPNSGLWEAADVQWWWRRPSRSDDLEKPFWLDEDGPVAGVLFSIQGEEGQLDPIVVPGTFDLEVVLAAALDLGRAHTPAGFEIPVDDDDAVLRRLVTDAGLTAGYSDSTAWLRADDRGAVRPPADGFTLVDRSRRDGVPHPMRERNGEGVAQRLAQCSLYDPTLDLAVETADGRSAGYALFWADPVTKVGLVEPVRVEDEFQRRGLASALVSAGVERLAARGMERIKVSFGSEIAGATYRGVGFRPTSTATWYGEKAPATA